MSLLAGAWKNEGTAEILRNNAAAGDRMKPTAKKLATGKHRSLPKAFAFWGLWGCLFVVFAGCPRTETEKQRSDAPPAKPFEGIRFRVTVVDDPALAAALRRVRGEWNVQTGAELDVSEASEGDLLKAASLPGDAVLCPSHLKGVLAERAWLAPMPAPILRNAEWAEIFPLLRLREAGWGRQIMAVPFGSPLLTVYYRADLFDKLGRRPPRTWTEYGELAKLLASTPLGRPGESPPAKEANDSSAPPSKETPASPTAWCGTIEPLAPGWAGLVLLARAAPYAKHRDNYSTLFDLETMEPLVASVPMVQALEELAATAKSGPADPFRFDPAAARAAFWRGECGMALSWPTAADVGEGAPNIQRAQGRVADHKSPGFPAGFVELPGAHRVFHPGDQSWIHRGDDEDIHVPLLSIAGRLGVVSAKSPQIEATFHLLLWLSDSRMSPQISAASPATTLFRDSNLKAPSLWVEKQASAAAAVRYADAAEAALRHGQWLGALCLPGRAEYLAALDEAVAAAVRGEKSAEDALRHTAAQWRDITNRLGVERQRAAYRHSLGLDGSSP